jgi:hypothetical protein
MTWNGIYIERAAVANEVLGDGEFTVATYALASKEGMLLAPTTLACWGPGQTVLPSVGNWPTVYNLVGGVVFGNTAGSGDAREVVFGSAQGSGHARSAPEQVVNQNKK